MTDTFNRGNPLDSNMRTTMNKQYGGVSLNGWSRHEREDIQVHVSRSGCSNETVHVALSEKHTTNNPNNKAIAVNMTPAEAVEFAHALLSAATL